MLAYGFVYPDNDSLYSDDDPANAVFVSEYGHLVRGTELNHDVVEPEAGESMSTDLMQARLRKLETMRDAVTNDLGSIVPLPVAFVDIYGDDGQFDTPAQMMAEFLQAMNNGESTHASSKDFLDMLRLSEEVGEGHDKDESQAMTSPYTPPNTTSKSYLPRKVGALKDVDVLTRARRNHLSVLLSGLPGSGKTALCEAAFGDELVTVSCHEGMTIADLVGQWMPVANQPGGFVWEDGPLVKAMEAGQPLLLDDFSWASMEVQAALLPVMDHRRQITVMDREKNKDVVAVAGFTVILTQNPSVGIGIIDPVLDRVAFTVEVPSDLDTATRLNADPDLLAVAYQLQEDNRKREEQGAFGWVPSIRTLLDSTKIQQVYGTEFAAATFLSKCPIDNPEYREFVYGLLKAQIGRDADIPFHGLTSQA